MDFSPKVNVISRLEFELAYFGAAVQHVSLYARGTTHWLEKDMLLFMKYK